jgi:hypothetical protein
VDRRYIRRRVPRGIEHNSGSLEWKNRRFQAFSTRRRVSTWRLAYISHESSYSSTGSRPTDPASPITAESFGKFNPGPIIHRTYKYISFLNTLLNLQFLDYYIFLFWSFASGSFNITYCISGGSDGILRQDMGRAALLATDKSWHDCLWVVQSHFRQPPHQVAMGYQRLRKRWDNPLILENNSLLANNTCTLEYKQEDKKNLAS